MKKHIIAFLFMVALVLGQIRIVRAIQKTYEWETRKKYQISIIALDNWQPGMPFEVKVRCTLTSKSAPYTTVSKSVKVVLSSETFIMPSTEGEGIFWDLEEVGQYWEKKFTFDIPDWMMNRGQTLNTSIVAIIDIDEVSHSYRYNYAWNNYDDPLTVSLYKPFLSTIPFNYYSNIEWILIVIAVVIIVTGTTGFVLYRRRKASVKPSSPS